MQFKDIVGQRDVINRLTEIIDSGRISHAQLLLGDERDGSLQLAWAYMQYLCCRSRVHQEQGKIFPEQVLIQSRTMLDKAAQLAADDPAAAKKVAFLRSGLEHAIITSHTSAVFADPKASKKDKWDALKKLRAFRSKLPPFAYDPMCWTAEKRWKIDGVRLEQMRNVPVDPGVKTYDEVE